MFQKADVDVELIKQLGKGSGKIDVIREGEAVDYTIVESEREELPTQAKILITKPERLRGRIFKAVLRPKMSTFKRSVLPGLLSGT